MSESNIAICGLITLYLTVDSTVEIGWQISEKWSWAGEYNSEGESRHCAKAASKFAGMLLLYTSMKIFFCFFSQLLYSN